MSNDDGHHWIGISDLLSGFVVVMILLFVASVALRAEQVKSAVEQQAQARTDAMQGLRAELASFADTVTVAVDDPRVEFMDSSFASGSACLDAQAEAAIDVLAPRVRAMLDQDPSLTVYVEGHSDPSTIRRLVNACGYFNDNTQLSTLRAANVRNRLVAGMDATTRARVPVSGWGAEKLRNTTDLYAAENRRVDVRPIWPSADVRTP